MCEEVEKLVYKYEAAAETRGEIRGEVKKAMAMALNLKKMGMSIAAIATAAETSEEQVQQWLASEA